MFKASIDGHFRGNPNQISESVEEPRLNPNMFNLTSPAAPIGIQPASAELK